MGCSGNTLMMRCGLMRCRNPKRGEWIGYSITNKETNMDSKWETWNMDSKWETRGWGQSHEGIRECWPYRSLLGAWLHWGPWAATRSLRRKTPCGAHLKRLMPTALLRIGWRQERADIFPKRSLSWYHYHHLKYCTFNAHFFYVQWIKVMPQYKTLSHEE